MVTHWIILNHWANGGDQLMVISFNAALCVHSVSLGIQDNALLILSLFCTSRFHSKAFFFQRLELLNSSEWCLLEELFLTWIMRILPLKGRTISQWAPFPCVLLPHSIKIQDEQAHFFLWIKKKYVFTVLIRLQGQSNLQIKHQQKGKTIKIQINRLIKCNA